ncbi:MAG: hypothetical protein A2Y62_21105 [Candidatus Fischerbacteria bacterium RBG_13_37_8]|uniref:Methyltransferase small domain-containing protein n=1 Tax=Candidatus Fischerbacteria bacterium RBG_13_37_8 TaxID=1817863 RepID=A0A1F5V6D2_9BACT|nr:MAG: hypothetical protein A2Y62_21105 [Candidatus Fischerbacteria bacterium RBG_13_37_8]
MADFIECDASAVWIDLGSGCGIIPIATALKKNFAFCWAIEMKAGLCFMAQNNIQYYHLQDKIAVLEADIREIPYYFPAHSFDLVASNPPYRPLSNGRLNHTLDKTIARHELFLNLDDLLESAVYLLKENAFLYIIYPYKYFAVLVDKLLDCHFHIHRKSVIKEGRKAAAHFILIKAGFQIPDALVEEESVISHNMTI